MEYNHIILDLKLNNTISIEQIDDIFQKIVKILNLSILKKEKYIFDNGWFTLFYVLAESHLSAHYRIENNYLALDIYSCRNIKKYKEEIIKTLKKLWIHNIKETKLLRNV